MKQPVKLLTRQCCENLLAFQHDEALRQSYNQDVYPTERLSWLEVPSGYKMDDSLTLSPATEDDVYSSMAIFEALKDLDRVQANDKRLWVALTHGPFFGYTRQRWMKNENYSNEAIFRRFHFEGSSLEARTRNSIARLWWAAKLTYDSARTDPFELTKVLWSRQDLIQNLVERSYGTYENVLIAFLEMYSVNQHLTDKELRQLYTGLNAIGGVKILPLLSKDSVREELARVAAYSGIDLART